MTDEKAQLKKLVRNFHSILCSDAKASTRVKAINTLLNGGYNLKLLDDADLETTWESIFYALWYAEMGRGCEEIIAAVERACSKSTRLTRYGFVIISKKWYGLDQYRVDKISHLARHLLPVLVNHQISIWFRTYNKTKKIGTSDLACPRLLRQALDNVVNSYGLCYFLLEILATEISKSLVHSYEKLDITVGKFELKANLIVFLYRQIIGFVTNTKLDARLLRTFDQYVIKKFMEEILPNESQLTQILITLRLYQNLDKHVARRNKKVTGKCRELLKRWSTIVRDTHENCINGEYFPNSVLPEKNTIELAILPSLSK